MPDVLFSDDAPGDRDLERAADFVRTPCCHAIVVQAIFADELALYVNGVLMGYLNTTPDNASGLLEEWLILQSNQIAGTNRIEIHQKTGGWKWGVSNLAIVPIAP